MKILYVINTLDIGGAEKLLVDIIEKLDDLNYEIGVYFLNLENTFLLNRLMNTKVCIYKSRISFYSPVHIYNIVKYVKKYDIIHANLFPSLYWVALARVFLDSKVKLVYTEHSTYNKRRDKRFFAYVERFIYSRYDKIIAISPQVRESLISWVGLSQKIEMIENAIDVHKYRNSFSHNKTIFKIQNDSIVILMSARFTMAKDQATLIKAFALLKQNNVVLVLVGEGPLKKDCIALTSQLGLLDSVFFLGAREDIPPIIQMSDICVLSSHWEGFGLVAVEYMAAGKPVIASDVPGLNDVVRGAGILFEAGNVHDLFIKLQSLIVNADYRREVSRRCEKRSMQYDISRLVDSYVNLYKSL